MMWLRTLFFCLGSAFLISCVGEPQQRNSKADVNTLTGVTASRSEIHIEGRALHKEGRHVASFPGVSLQFVALGMDMTLELVAETEGQYVDVFMGSALMRFDLDIGENTLNLAPL